MRRSISTARRQTRAEKARRQSRPLKGPQTNVSYDGLFRTSIKGIIATIDPETGESNYKAWLEVAWEPTLQPFYLETRPQNLVVKVEQGKQLLPVDLGSSIAPVDGRNALLFETPLPTLPRTAKQLDSVTGKLSIIAPNRMLTLTSTYSLDELEKKAGKLPTLKPKSSEPEGVVCQLSKIKLATGHWEVQVTLDYPPGNTELGSSQSWAANNELILESKDGKTRSLGSHRHPRKPNAASTLPSLISSRTCRNRSEARRRIGRYPTVLRRRWSRYRSRSRSKMYRCRESPPVSGLFVEASRNCSNWARRETNSCSAAWRTALFIVGPSRLLVGPSRLLVEGAQQVSWQRQQFALKPIASPSRRKSPPPVPIRKSRGGRIHSA